MDEQNKDVEGGGGSGLEFNEAQSSISQHTQKEHGIVQWVIAYSGGMIKNKKEAEYVVIGFIVITTLVSIYLFLGIGPVEVERNIDPTTGIEIIPGQVPGHF